MTSLVIDDFEVLGKFRTVSFGSCLKVRNVKNGGLFFLKAIKYDLLTEETKRKIICDLNELSRLSNSHLIKINARILKKDIFTLFIIMEWCFTGNLRCFIEDKERKGEALTEDFGWKVLSEVGSALQALPARLLSDRPFHATELFLDLEGNIKLCPLGFARVPWSDASRGPHNPLNKMEPCREPERESCRSATGCLGLLIKQICSKFEKSCIEIVRPLQRRSMGLGVVVEQLLSARPGEELETLEKIQEACRVRELELGVSKISVSALRERQMKLNQRETSLTQWERSLVTREKKIALLERLAKEKLARAQVYLHQVRSRRKSEPTLDTSFSADPGDTSILPTSARVDPQSVPKPNFQKHVHFEESDSSREGFYSRMLASRDPISNKFSHSTSGAETADSYKENSYPPKKKLSKLKKIKSQTISHKINFR